MKIAIIGTGISGLTAAYGLHDQHDITLFEKNDYVGGHSRTIQAGGVDVDIGFIVFNKRNYPYLTALFDHLSIAYEPSPMSFGVSVKDMEYAGNARGLFANPKHFITPKFYGMLLDIMRFFKQSLRILKQNDTRSLGQFLDDANIGTWCQEYFVLPMGAAIWSTSLHEMRQFPAYTFLKFFEAHGLLTITNQPQWHTVTGGSKNYVKKLTAPFKQKIQLNTPIQSVKRTPQGIEVNGKIFDKCIMACHGDTVLKLLQNPTSQEQEIFSQFTYSDNKVVVHSDIAFMAKRPAAQASWLYQSNDEGQIALTYDMNKLQNLTTEKPLLVTLNPHQSVKADAIYHETNFTHPIYTQSMVEAGAKIDDIQGDGGIYYVGAYQRYGFHEDGCMSAVKVLQKGFGITPDWLPH